MKLSLPILKEYIYDIPSSLYGQNNHNTIQEIRLFSQHSETKADTAYIGTEEQFFHSEGNRIVCSFQDAYIIFDTDNVLLILNRLLDAFSCYAKWYEQCESMISAGCSLPELLEISEIVIKHPLLIVDSSQYIIGISPSAISHSSSEEWKTAVQDMSMDSDRLKEFNKTHEESFHAKGLFHLPADFFPAPSSCRHIFLEDERIGTLIMIEDKEPLTTGQEHLSELLIPVISRWISSCMETDSSAHGISVFAKVLDNAPGAEQNLSRRLNFFGWEKTCEMKLIVARSVSETVHFDSRMSRVISKEKNGIYSIPYDKHLLILLNLDIIDTAALFRELSFRFSQNHYSGAESYPFRGFHNMPEAYGIAQKTLEKCPLEQGYIYSSRDYSLEHFAFFVRKKMNIFLLHPLPGEIKAYDDRHKTDYYMTLFVFLECERNHTLTANRLFIHRNTLFLRLKKIQELWAPDLENGKERFLILMTFYYLSQQDTN